MSNTTIYLDQDIVKACFGENRCPFNITRDIKKHLANRTQEYIDELETVINNRNFKKPLFTHRKGKYNGQISIQKIDIADPQKNKGKSKCLRFIVFIDFSEDLFIVLSVFAKGHRGPNTDGKGDDIDDNTHNMLKTFFKDYTDKKEI